MGLGYSVRVGFVIQRRFGCPGPICLDAIGARKVKAILTITNVSDG